jgi:hypothetical protein
VLRSCLALALFLSMVSLPLPANGSDNDARARADAQAALEKYLAARFRGAAWPEFAATVAWDKADEPTCTTVVRSYSIDRLRLKDKRTALASVVFFELGSYCPADATFQPAPRLDNVIFQLRRRSIFWQVEKTSRPGGQVDWKIVREELRQRRDDPATSAADATKLASALAALEKTANAAGKTLGNKQ